MDEQWIVVRTKIWGFLNVCTNKQTCPQNLQVVQYSNNYQQEFMTKFAMYRLNCGLTASSIAMKLISLLTLVLQASPGTHIHIHINIYNFQI